MALTVFEMINKLSQSGSFLERVRVAAVKYAVSIDAEKKDTPFHAQRREFARQVVLASDRFAVPMAYATATQVSLTSKIYEDETGQIQTSATDEEIENTVLAVWNTFAVSNDT